MYKDCGPHGKCLPVASSLGNVGGKGKDYLSEARCHQGSLGRGLVWGYEDILPLINPIDLA